MGYNDVFTATVLVSLPERGMCVVVPNIGIPGAGVPVVASMPRTDAATGASEHCAYAAGTTVFCSRAFDNSMLKLHIVGVCNASDPDTRDNPLDEDSPPPVCLYGIDDFSQSDVEARGATGLARALLPNNGHRWLRSSPQGADPDSLPGDYNVLDRNSQAGLHIGRLVSTLRASGMAFVDASAVNNSVRVVGDSISTHGLTHESEIACGYSVSNTAFSVAEAFGARKGSVMRADDGGRLRLVDKDALPLYRIQRMEGAVIGGVEENILDFPQASDRHVGECEPAVLSRRRRSLSGELTEASVLGLASVKSPFIPAVQQVGYGFTPEQADNGVYTELREPHTGELKEHPDVAGRKTPDEEEELTDAALNKLIGSLLAGDYRDQLLKVMSRHGFSIASEDASLKRRMGSSVKEPGGITQRQHYPPPPSIPVVDPVTGESRRCYATTSFITQEPDGSICLCDGYGSEIRMSRGNIYISPALDLFFRPGRDLSAMAGRHQAYNSQGSCTINSSDSVFVRAVRDLKIAGATGGAGAVTLENLASPGAGGVVIRSNSDMSVTASGTMYIGRNAHSTENKNRITEPDRPGSIVLDAGSNGGCYMRGMACTLDSSETVVGGFTNGLRGIGGSAVVVRPGEISLLAMRTTMPTQLLATPLDKPAVPLMLCRDGKAVSASLDTATSGSMWLGGSMVVGENLIVNGTGKFNGNNKTIGLMSHGISSIPGTTEMLDSIDPKPKGDNPKTAMFYPIELPRIKASAGMGDNAAALMEAAASQSYQDYYVMGNGFRFPDYQVYLETVPGMVWQDRSKASDAPGSVWSEQYIKGADGKDTACYPGINAWEGAGISSRGYGNPGKLSDGYVINANPTEVR